jgi:hypothetical protein
LLRKSFSWQVFALLKLCLLTHTIFDWIKLEGAQNQETFMMFFLMLMLFFPLDVDVFVDVSD